MAFISCNQTNRSIDRLESDVKDTSSVFLDAAAKNNLKEQTLTYLKCLEGTNIDSLYKFVYVGSLKSLMAQDSLLDTQEKAFEYLKDGMSDIAKEINRKGYKSSYDIGEIDKITLLGNVVVAHYKVITSTRYKKILVHDTTTFLALAFDAPASAAWSASAGTL